MALTTSLDIKDALTTVPAWQMTTQANQMPLTTSGNTPVGLSLAPSKDALWITPYQYLPDWNTRQKPRLADWNNNSAVWTEHQVRPGGSDWWLSSLGTANEQLVSKFIVPRNCGIYVEQQVFGKTKQAVVDIFDIKFGLYYQLFVDSNGSARLYDSRNTAQLLANGQPDAPLATGSLSKGSLIGKTFNLTIFPYRRQYLCISSDDSHFVVNVNPYGKPYVDPSSPDKAAGSAGLNVITEAAPITIFATAAPVQALLCVSVLQYPNSKSVTTPNWPTPHVLAAQPALSSISDTEFGTSITLTPTITYNSLAPQSVFGYTATFNSSNGSSVVTGAVTTAAFTIGHLHSPTAYSFQVGAERQLGTLEYDTNIIPDVQNPRLVLDQDRTRKSWEFEIPNLDDQYTSIKDLQLRKIAVTLDTAENAGLVADLNHPYITDDTDPDMAWITENGGPIPIFVGYMTDVDFTDGTKSRLKITCKSMRQKLDSYILSANKDYDGVAHTDAVLDILKGAGFRSQDEATLDDPAEIYIYADDTPLPSASPGSQTPLFEPQNVPASDFLDLILKFSGWILDDLGGVWYYAPQDFFIEGGINAFGVPTIQSMPTYFDAQESTYSQSVANGSLEGITALNDPPLKQKQVRPIVANEIYVLYTTDDGLVGCVDYVDPASQSDRTAINYVGMRLIYVLEFDSINSIDAAVNVCTILAQDLPYPKMAVEFSLPDYRPELAIGSAVHVENYTDGIVTAIDADFSKPNGRKTAYTVELLNPVGGY